MRLFKWLWDTPVGLTAWVWMWGGIYFVMTRETSWFFWTCMVMGPVTAALVWLGSRGREDAED